MPVFIKQVSVQNLGPHNRFTFELGRFNLVYGHNENGKTFLVEFLIRSLFRNAKQWGLREPAGTGKVSVSGLTERALVEFSPEAVNKLEDYWQETQPGLPADFARLLVVKGAEVDLAKVDGGVDKTIIKKLLSNKAILDSLQNRISKTIQETKLQNGLIAGPRRGELTARYDLESTRKKIEELFAQIDKSYSGGKRKELAIRLEELTKEKTELNKAKRFLAYQTAQQAAEFREQCNKISREKLNQTRTLFAQYKKSVAEYASKQALQNEAAEASKHYDWLKSVQSVYQNNLMRETEPPPAIFIILSIVLIIGAGVLSFFSLPVYASAALALALISGSIYFKKHKQLLAHGKDNEEIANIKTTFHRNFNKELSGLPDIVERMQQLEEDYNSAKLLNTQLKNDLVKLHEEKHQISEEIFELTGEKIDPKNWDEILINLDNDINSLENALRQKELFLAELQVDPSDYVYDEPAVRYSRQAADELADEIAKTSATIETETQKLNSLKQLICQQTDDDISDSWDKIISNLRNKYLAISREYEIKTAEIIAKIAVNEVIEAMRRDEDVKIIENLKSKTVQQPVFELTNRYESVMLENDKLVVADQFNTFEVNSLSTGAQEQVLLALRIGFCLHLTRGETMFLILDDAFQYSDWRRRKFLVDRIAQLAQSGWQIIYFSMDDNIKALFEQKAKQFGDDYRLINLNQKTKTVRQLDILQDESGN